MVGAGLLAGAGGGSFSICLVLLTALVVRVGGGEAAWLWVLLGLIAFACGILSSRIAELDSFWQTAISGIIAGCVAAAIYSLGSLVLIRSVSGGGYWPGFTPFTVAAAASMIGALLHAAVNYRPAQPAPAFVLPNPTYIKLKNVPPPVAQSAVQPWSVEQSEMVEVGSVAVLDIPTVMALEDLPPLVVAQPDEAHEAFIASRGVAMIPAFFSLLLWLIVSIFLPIPLQPLTLLLCALLAGVFSTLLRGKVLAGGGLPAGLLVGFGALLVSLWLGLQAIGIFAADRNPYVQAAITILFVLGGAGAGWLGGYFYRRAARRKA